MVKIASAHEFIRCLKSQSDPPAPGLPSKIELASLVWADDAFILSNKPQVIVEWILGKLMKGKWKKDASNSIHDDRYWALLSTILTSQKASESRSMKTWLNPILQNTSFSQIIVAFFDSLPDAPLGGSEAVIRSVSDCTQILWASASQRATVENLQDTFGVYLKHASTSPHRSATAKIGALIAGSYFQALVKSSNRRKLFSSFLKAHLRHWTLYLNGLSSGSLNDQDAVVKAGLETLFNLDVLRQNQDSADDHPVFAQLQQSLENTPPDAILNALPVLFSAFVKSNRVYQGALYSQGSKGTPGTMLDGVRNAGMRYFAACQHLLQEIDQNAVWWKTQDSLLRTINAERLLSETSAEGKALLVQFMDKTINSLPLSPTASPAHLSAKIECLALLADVDFDLVAPSVPRVLVRFCLVPQSNPSSFKFLDIVLEYHAKTRTLDSLVDDMISAILNHDWTGIVSPHEYVTLLSSPPMDPSHLGRLAVSFRNLLTPRQIAPVAKNICDRIKLVWQTFRPMMKQGDETEDGPPASLGLHQTSPVLLAAQISMLCRFASVLLTSLPLEPLPKEMVEEVQVVVREFWSETVDKMISSSLKTVKKRDESGTWAASVVASAALRLSYALSIASNFKDIDVQEHETSSKLMKALKREGVLPELLLEITRTLLLREHTSPSGNFDKILDHILLYIETHLSNDIAWSGHEQDLGMSQEGRTKCALALLHLLMDRWILVVERNASPKNRTEILQLLFKGDLNASCPSNGITHGILLTRVMHSAQFWEHRSIRESFLELVLTASKAIDAAKPNSQHLVLYRTLTLIPTEYFPPSHLNTLIQNAVRLDEALVSTKLPQTERQDIVYVRLFIRRAVEYLTSIPLSPDGITQYIKRLEGISLPDSSMTCSATLGLVGVFFKHLVRRVQNGDPAPLLNAIPTVTGDALSNVNSFRIQCFLVFVDMLERDIAKTALHEDVLATLRATVTGLLEPLSADLGRFSSIDLTEDNIRKAESLVSLWCRVLALEKWLGFSHAETVPRVGRSLVVQLLRQLAQSRNLPALSKTLSSTFSILVQELDFYPEQEHPDHLDLVVASFTVFSKDNTSLSTTIYDIFAQTVRNVSPSDYAHLTGVLADALFPGRHRSFDDLAMLVRLSDLLLRYHPQNTLIHLQKFINRCINGFCNNPLFIQGPSELRFCVLDLLSQYCLDQQAALRPVDVSGIWSYLGALLAPSKDHDKATETKIFHKIFAVISPLIRLRRDLITPTIPLLGALLRRMILCLRACRPNLGARQTSLVMDTQPRWIHETGPLRGEEAKVLARLIESLTTKTVVRIMGSSSQEHNKAESLAKPFSKHAPHVLKAYIEAMNDPLCVLSLEVRTELQPGLFALCGMMNEHNRDALMVSALDTGGKATMKMVWKAYEKQRYVGKG